MESFDELIARLPAEMLMKIEQYMFEKFKMQRHRNIAKKREAIINTAMNLDNQDYDRLNDYIDGLLGQ